jgi:hypothetical protein
MIVQDEVESAKDDLLEEGESNRIDGVPVYEEINQKLKQILTGISNIIISIVYLLYRIIDKYIKIYN